MKIIHHFVEGKNFSGNSKRTGKVFNPATGEQIAEVKLATSNDVDQALASAKKLLVLVEQTSSSKSESFFKFKELIEKILMN